MFVGVCVGALLLAPRVLFCRAEAVAKQPSARAHQAASSGPLAVGSPNALLVAAHARTMRAACAA